MSGQVSAKQLPTAEEQTFVELAVDAVSRRAECVVEFEGRGGKVTMRLAGHDSGASVGGWLETFAQPFTTIFAAEDRPRFLAEVVEVLRDLLCDETGNWRADYVRLRFSAAKPGTAT